MNVVETVENVGSITAVRPPLPGPRVCKICRGPTRDESGFCWCCHNVCAALGEDPGSMPHVFPMVVFRPGDAWNITLRRYKDAPVVAARRHFANLLTAEVERFLAVHGGCIRAKTDFDSYCVVPSSRPESRAKSPHPLEAVLAGIGALGSSDAVHLSPVQPTYHLQPSITAFAPVDSSRLAGRRVLLADDTWVTGARALSAVVALRSARATVAGVLVIGRSVDPSASSNSRSWWDGLCRVCGEPGSGNGASPCSDECVITRGRQ